MLASLRKRPEPEQRAMQVTPWGPWGNSSGSASGTSVTESSAVQLLTVYGAVSLIADTIATLPTDVYQNGDPPEEATKPRWLEQPNPNADIVELLTQSLWSLLLAGNCYWVYGLDNRFVTNQVVVLDPEVVVPRVENGKVVYYVNGNPFTGRLLHIKAITRPGDLMGYSPLEAARQSIGLGLAAQEFAARFYNNGATLSGTITTDADLTEPQAKQLQEQWASSHSGLANAHKPGVLDNGAKWNPTSVTPEQAQFLESRNFQSAEISGQLFLLDPTLLGIQVSSNSLTYANLEQRGIHLVQFTLLRWIIRLERAVTYLLPRVQYFKFNVAGLERADLKTRYESHRIALGSNVPWETVNEVREIEEMSPMPGQDKLPEPATAPAAGLQTFPTPKQEPASKNGHKTVTKIVERGKDGRIDHIVEVG